jgi:hypothetical protein
LSPFGKYKHQLIERLLADADYLDWVKGQPGLMRSLESRHPAFFNIIVTGGAETETLRIPMRFSSASLTDLSNWLFWRWPQARASKQSIRRF